MSDGAGVARGAAAEEAGTTAAGGWNSHRDVLAGLLDEVLAEGPEIQLACLSMVDGRVFAASSRMTIEPPRIAALSSSLLAISESFSRDVRGGQCDHTTISTEHGSIVTVRVPMSARVFALSLCVERTANLAMALRWTLDTATRLALVLESH